MLISDPKLEWPAQHLHLTMWGTHPTYMSERHVRTHILPWEEPIQSSMSERPSTHIWPWEEPIQHSCQKGYALTFDHARNQSNIHVKRALHLHSTMRGTNPTYMSKGLSAPGWGFLVTNQVPPFSQRMASALISDQVGTNPSITSEWPCTYIW